MAIQTETVPETSDQTAVATREAVTVAVVNMKGGVGKSTITANLGWYCVSYKGMRVLLVDLDPQFNLSQYVLGESGYESHLDKEGLTVFDVFDQQTRPGGRRPTKRVAPQDVIVEVGDWTWRDGGKLDLLPSSLDLSVILKNPSTKERLLSLFLKKVRSSYDLVLIDCAPTESMLTHAAYLASDYILVPVRAEFLSTIGLPLLVSSLEDFKEINPEKDIEMLGIVFNGTGDKPEHDRSRGYVAHIAAQQGWHVFKNEVSHSDSYPKGSRTGQPIFRTGYARNSKIRDFRNVAEEFAQRVGI